MKTDDCVDNKEGTKNIVFLNGLFLVYSFAGFFLKKASPYTYFSAPFLAFVSLAILVCVIYAIGWQHALKKVSLSSAYLNKSVVIIWGLIWSVIFLNEELEYNVIVGGSFIILGVLLVVKE